MNDKQPTDQARTKIRTPQIRRPTARIVVRIRRRIPRIKRRPS
jgi:hypothetical protein